MRNATLLIVLGKSTRPADLAPISETALRNNLHLDVLILGTMPQIPASVYGTGAYGSYALPNNWQFSVDEENRILDLLRTELSAYLSDQGVSAEVRFAAGEIPAIAETVTHMAQTCDKVIIGDDLRGNEPLFSTILRAALFQAPAGVMLNVLKSTASLQPKSAFVAWKAGVPSSRAVQSAIPILQATDEVVIALFDAQKTGTSNGENPGSDVAAWLSHQGCHVTLQQYPSGGEEIGKLIVTRAREVGSELIVMGAYDHSRLRETIFGGTTRTMIEQTDFPILMSH